MVCVLATSLLPLRNTLRAEDVAVESINTFAQMDSLFRTHYDPLVSPGKGTGWKPFNRMEWFYGQRAFPSGDIPIGARMQAWETKRSSHHRDRTLDENWTAMGPNNIAGRMLTIAWHPTNTNIIYVGAASGGLWKTTNGGTSWLPLTDDLPSLAIGSVALDPSNLNTVYIGTGEGAYNVDAVLGAGILKSTDAGSTWNTTGMSWTQSQGRAINKLIVHPTNSQILWCATNIWSGGGGVYKSTDGGSSWTRYLSGDTKDLIIHPDSANVLYAAIGYPWGGSSNGVYKSEDGGATWTLRSSGLPSATSMGRMALTISQSSEQTLYVGISQTISAGAGLLGIYRTTNAGGSWTLQASTPNMYSGQGWYNIVCEVHPTNSSIVYSSGLDLYKSTNGGVNWSQKTYWNYPPGHSLYAHADHHALAFKPGDPNTIIAGTDGGLYKSTNGGDTWTDLNSGLATYQFYAMCNDQLNGNTAYGGTQDNGTNKYTGSTTWSAVLGGDGAYCNVDHTNSNIIYAGTQRGSHYKSTNGGSSFYAIQSGISGVGAWVTPRVMDPSNATVLYTGTTMVYKTTNGGSNWSAISSALSTQYISTIAIAPSNSQVIYVGYENNGQVWKTTNGGTNWTSCYSGLPYRYITRVAVHPTDPNTVMVTVSGYGTGHIWKSTNGGTSWTNVSTGVPDMPCNSIVYDTNDPNKLYVATDLGVYATTNGGSSWSDYSNGMPNVVVDDIALHPTTGMLRAATHGRGMWQTSTGTPSVAVQTPNGGESWIAGGSQNITWATGGLGGNVAIELNRDYPGGSWESLTSSTSNDGSFTWTVTNPTTTHARVRITSVETPAATDISNADFSITQPQLTLSAPNGGETWIVNSSQTISWTLSGTTGNVVVQIDRSYPSGNWTTLTTTSSSSYAWTVTTPASSTARIRIYLQALASVGDTSSANFNIVEPAVAVTYPNGGESLTPGSIQRIRWTTQYLSGSVKVELNRSYPSGSWVTLASTVTADSLVWTVDQNGTTSARVRVTSNSYTSATDVSDANFTVLTPTLAVTTPNGGEVAAAGFPYVIRWSRTNLDGPLNVYVNREYSTGTWSPIAVGVTADTFAWNVTTPYSNAARIRVSSVTLPTLLDESNSNFVIGTGIVVSSPNGGESWAVGSSQTISWARYNAAGAATVQINRSYPAGAWETLSSSVTTDSYSWTVTGPGSAAARVRVFLTATPTIGDSSNNNFSIPAPGLLLTSPLGGEAWGIGTSQNITWVRNDAEGNVTVQLNRTYPGGTWETLTTTAAGTSHAWTVTASATTTARVRVFLTAATSVGDTSNTNFGIGIPQLTLLAPAGGETWLIGSVQKIRWSRQFASGDVRVMLNRSYPGGSWETLASAVAVDSLQWTVTAAASSAARVRIYLVSNSTVADTSGSHFTIAAPGITVTSPNGGEAWVIGEAQTITFARNNADGEATVQVNRAYPSGTWENISTTVTGTSVSWTPTGSASTACRVRVFLNSAPSARDSSNANFSLISASLTVTAPNGGISLGIGSATTITWTRSNATGPVTVVLNRNYPSGSWDTLSTTETSNSMSWTVTGPATTLARVRVSLNSNPAIADESNANFSIVQPALTLSAPNGGESYTLGGPLTVRWTRTLATGGVSVLLNRNYPSGGWETLTTGVTVDTFRWTAVGAASSTCRIKIQLTADETINDVSAANFSFVAKALALTSHNSGETVYTGSTSSVTFTRTNATGNVTVQLNRNYPAGSWETLTSTVTASTYSWSVSGALSANARLRVFLTAEAFVGDTTETGFAIAAPSLTMIYPNGGETWLAGSSQTIQWQRAGVSENVRVDLKRNYPSGSWETIASSVSGNGYVWTVSGSATNARIRVVSTTTSTRGDTSNANFTIISAPIALITPNGGETLNAGFPYTIKWTRFQADGEVRVDLNRSYPAGSWEVLGTTTTDSLVWNASGAASTTARIKVYLISNPSVGDTSVANFTIFQPSLVLTSPAGGEHWAAGSTYLVAWTRSGLAGSVRLELDRAYPSGTWETIVGGQTGNNYSWTVTQPTTEQARLRIVYESQPVFGDTSNDFSIMDPGLAVLWPNNGDTLIIGQAYTFRWMRAGVTGPVRIDLNRNYPDGAWEVLNGGTSADTMRWTVTGAVGLHSRLRVQLVTNSSISDVSDVDFLIAHQSLHLLTPVAGDSIALGLPVQIAWSSVGLAPGVNIYIKRNWPSGSWETLASNAGGNSYTWTASGAASETARIRVLATTNPMMGDTTDGAVRIGQPQFVYVMPSAADTFYAGETVTLKWSRRFTAGTVRVELSRQGTGGPWEEIGIADGDSILWNVTGPVTNIARLRITSVDVAWISSMTSFNCAILVPSLNVTLPAAGYVQALGRSMTVIWTRTSFSSPVDVLLERSPGAPLELLRSGVAGDSIHWTASGSASGNARITVRSSAGIPLEAQSGLFSLAAPELILATPSAGHNAIAGRNLSLTWRRLIVNDPVKVDICRSYPGGAWTTLTSSVSDTFYNWTVTEPGTNNARLRIVSTVDASLGDTMAGNFQILVPSLFFGDLGRARIIIGFPAVLSWTRIAVEGPVNLYLSRNGGASFSELIAANVAGDSYTWIPTEPPTEQARIMVRSVQSPSISAQSDDFVLALPQLLLANPIGGETVPLGSVLPIRWTREDHPAGVHVTINRSYPGGSWQTLAVNVDADSFLWTVNGSETESARIRITSSVKSTWTAESGTFSIRAAALHITAPISNQELWTGDSFNVSWQRTAYTGAVRVLLRTAAGITDTLAANVTGVEAIGLLSPRETENSWIVIEDMAQRVPRDSIAVRGPYAARLAITSPANGVRWVLDHAQSIEFTRQHAEGDVSVAVSRNYPVSAWESLGTTASNEFLWIPIGEETEALSVRVMLDARPGAADTIFNMRLVRPGLALNPLAQSEYEIGSDLQISWSNHETDGGVRLELDRNYPSGAWTTLYEGEGSQFTWPIAGDTTSHARLRIVSVNYAEAADTLESDVTFFRRELEFVGTFETDYDIGDVIHTEWQATWSEGPYRLLALREGLPAETLLSNSTATSFDWTVTPPRSDHVSLVILDEVTGLADTSSEFTVHAPALTFLLPAESGIDTVGNILAIAWQWTDGSGAVKLEVSRDSLNGTWQTLSDNTNEAQYFWTVVGPGTDSLRIRVSSFANPAIYAISPVRRVIEPGLSLQLGGGETWYVGEQKWIRWQRTNYSGAVDVEVTAGDRADPWETLAQVTVDSFLWTVTGPAADMVALRITARDRPELTDTTDSPLRIVMPQIRVVAPNGGEVLETDQEIRLRWTGEGFGGDVSLVLWRGEPVNEYDTLFAATVNDSSEIWTVSGPAAQNCYLIVTALSNAALADTSDGVFEIRGPSAIGDARDLPREYALNPPYPNPFNAVATMEFALPHDGTTQIVIFDIMGREVERLVDDYRKAGTHRVSWNANRVGSGVYFARMTSGDYHAVRKLHLIK